MAEGDGLAQRSRAQFGRQASHYAGSVTHREGESLQALTGLAARGRYRRAVDIATGAGFTACAVSPFAERVLATDITPAMIREARGVAASRGLTDIGFALVTAEALPFATGSLDLVTCRVAPHHFQDLPLAVSEWARVLAPGGTLLLADTTAPEDPEVAAWMQDFEVRRDPSHGRNLPPSEWLALLEASGLAPQESALTAVPHEFEDWVRRSGTPPDEVGRLRRDILSAPPAAVDAFHVRRDGSGRVLFQWECLVVLATRV